MKVNSIGDTENTSSLHLKVTPSDKWRQTENVTEPYNPMMCSCVLTITTGTTLS